MLNTIHWFRKGLRLHDNPALMEACDFVRNKGPSSSSSSGARVYPLFILDPAFCSPETIGVNRYSFLLESLADLDSSLRRAGSRLFVAKGKPEELLPRLADEWGVGLITYEGDTEPYARLRDEKIHSFFSSSSVIKSESKHKVKLSVHWTHTLFPVEHYLAKAGQSASGPQPPLTYQSFLKLFYSCGTPRMSIDAPGPGRYGAALPTASTASDNTNTEDALKAKHAATRFDVPTLAEMGYGSAGLPTTPFRGGETVALQRLDESCAQRLKWVCQFEKPNTSPNSLTPSTTVLSPYLKFGCLSVTKFYNMLTDICKLDPKHTLPPVSLHGQLLWREFFYLSSAATPNFDKMIGNPRCKQIPWDRDAEKILAWKEGRTGYPFIDAIMAQLRVEGWIHHLARHAVACFLTRGDLWQHWEEGARVFDLYLLDSDWALNNANWQWLSCSNFYYQYFRCYSPIAFGMKTDPEGLYIKKWLPQLSKYNSKYIFEPWKAPKELQREWGCVIGKDYPQPMVTHSDASKENMNRMKTAYDNQDEILRVGFGPGSAGSTSSGGGGGGGGGNVSKSKLSAGDEGDGGKRKLSKSSSSSSKVTDFFKKPKSEK